MREVLLWALTAKTPTAKTPTAETPSAARCNYECASERHERCLAVYMRQLRRALRGHGLMRLTHTAVALLRRRPHRLSRRFSHAPSRRFSYRTSLSVLFLSLLTLSQLSAQPGANPASPTVPPPSEPSITTSRHRDLDFDQQIRPLLRRCSSCHGPDAATRKRGLRLDTFEGATAALTGGLAGTQHDPRNGKSIRAAVVPGHPERSILLERVRSTDPNIVMPPPGKGEPFTDLEVARLEEWIQQGARYSTYWAFVPPRPVVPPKVASKSSVVRTDIDAFILERLHQNGFDFNPEADRSTLIRRLSLDLTGLPPTVEEVERFCNDTRPDYYAHWVDHLLAKPSYGERWARVWLDLARYADSRGYEKDGARTIWPYRDLVIRRLNDDQPYDQFTVEQLAGDLLPQADDDQLLATAFHRNTMTNDEGGTDDEEFRVEAVVDRVNTTLQVWMGLTAGCARCHSHKYDPISHEDYYRLFAIFNQTRDQDLASDEPLLTYTPAATAREISRLRLELEQAQLQREPLQSAHDAARDRWRQQLTRQPPPTTLPPEVRYRFDADDEVQVEGNAQVTAGLFEQALQLASGGYASAATVGDLERDQPFSVSAWLWLHSIAGVNIPWARMDDTQDHRGWDLYVQDGSLVFHAIHSWPDNALRTQTAPILEDQQWHHVLVSYDGSSQSAGICFYVDGRPLAHRASHDSLSKSIRTPTPLHFGKRHTAGSYRGRIDEWALFHRALSPEQTLQQLEQSCARLFAVNELTPEALRVTQRFFDLHHSDTGWLDTTQRITQLHEQTQRLLEQRPRVPVLAELEQSAKRKTFILEGGNFLQRAAEVEPGVPLMFPPLVADAPADRLALAHWLTRPDNPLTARVLVNRLWEQIFGVGLVASSEDFGTQGDLPSHPELLDTLAVRMQQRGWSLKKALKEIVCSTTYRQSAVVAPALASADPRNRWLGRAPNYRLDGEVLRDQALAVSGLLHQQMYGPPVFPYQPDGIWQAVYDSSRWTTSAAPQRHRRSLYTYWRRTSPYPSMVTFDAPSREVCTSRRLRTNTPLQALVTLNDPVFVEAAQALARELHRSAPAQAPAATRDRAKLDLLLQRTLARTPSAAERETLLTLLQSERKHFRQHPESAVSAASDPLGALPEGSDPVELATWTVLCQVVLNLDEFLTRP